MTTIDRHPGAAAPDPLSVPAGPLSAPAGRVSGAASPVSSAVPAGNSGQAARPAGSRLHPGARTAAAGRTPAAFTGGGHALTATPAGFTGTDSVYVAPAPAPAPTLSRVQRIVSGATVLAAAGIGLAGLYLSFEHVAAYAHSRLGFRTLGQAKVFTAGVDLGILVLIAISLLLAWLRRPMPGLRWPIILLTGATVVLNGTSVLPGGRPWSLTDAVAVFAHAVVPTLFIIVVEVGRKAIDRALSIEPPARTGIPPIRWLLAPWPTFRLWRRMRLWAVATYAEAAELEQRRVVYRARLKRHHGRLARFTAPEEARLPLTMARFGLSVEDALLLPQQEADREARLAEAKEAAEEAAQERKAQRETDRKIAALHRRGELDRAQYEADATTGQAAVAAQAAAERDAAEDRQKAVEAETATAKADLARLEAHRRRAEEEALIEAADARKAAAERDAAEDRQKAVEAETAELQALADQAQARRLIAQEELRAAELGDEARMSPAARAARQLARRALTHKDGDVEQIPLKAIAEEYDVSEPTASRYRKAAGELLASGYRPVGT
ncbi:DUF2637 domain-containing protein (plasmid) [Kitasatospora purpeofusca]|uniref:DUF2637 domain-containing protein n=1 Tax=Kitasatospora purpeofusca TaxID=67352 RepID=UPI002E153F50|nr:DUF2637 domain-containing protein [Kitasatospora purpeofusca]